MIHQKHIDDFLARRNLSKYKKPFFETVHILHVGSKYYLVQYDHFRSGRITIVEQIREYQIFFLLFQFSIILFKQWPGEEGNFRPSLVTNSKLTVLSSVKVESYLGLKPGHLTDWHHVELVPGYTKKLIKYTSMQSLYWGLCKNQI